MGPSAGLDNTEKAQFFGSVKNVNTIPRRSKLYPNHHTYGLYQLNYCTSHMLKHTAI